MLCIRHTVHHVAQVAALHRVLHRRMVRITTLAGYMGMARRSRRITTLVGYMGHGPQVEALLRGDVVGDVASGDVDEACLLAAQLNTIKLAQGRGRRGYVYVRCAVLFSASWRAIRSATKLLAPITSATGHSIRSMAASAAKPPHHNRRVGFTWKPCGHGS